ncbi:EamA family transporter [Candidatus Woesearchaeota archaeon]|nr:EamA family transporter [Candidatus Woesearchaeota archaeon]
MVLEIPWYGYAFVSVVFSTIFVLLRKKALLKEHAMNFESARTLFLALFGLFLIPFINLNINKKIFILIYVVSLAATTAILFFSKAVRHNDISLVFPLSNFKPAFVAVIALLFLSEAITTKQIIGIVILLISAYLLESNHHLSNLTAPIKNLLKTKYNLYFIFSIFLFSITAVLDKYVITNYTNIFTYLFLIWIFIAINFNLFHLFIYGYKDTINCLKRTKGLPVLVAFLAMVKNLFAFKALSLTYVTLLTPVLMLETLFIVLLGGKFFHEKFLFFRFSVSSLMLVGAYLIII